MEETAQRTLASRLYREANDKQLERLDRLIKAKRLGSVARLSREIGMPLGKSIYGPIDDNYFDLTPMFLRYLGLRFPDIDLRWLLTGHGTPPDSAE